VLSPGDAGVVARAPALPGLAVLLDGELLDRWLSAHLRRPVRVHRRYLRYKPGTSCVLGADLDGPDGVQPVFVATRRAGSVAKLEALAQAAPAGTVLAFDRQAGLLAATSSADSTLPALAPLADRADREGLLRELVPDLHAGRLSTLVHKPYRRWVGKLEAGGDARAVLRAYPAGGLAAAVAPVAALAAQPTRTPQLLGTAPRRALAAVEHLPGTPLDRLLEAPGAHGGVLRSAGAALATLHSSRVSGLPRLHPEVEADAVLAAARQVTALLPDVAVDAHALACDLAQRLAAQPGAAAPVHGDFSADQVVVGPDGGVALIDLDAAACGDPAVDLGGFTAALVAAAWLRADDVGRARVPEQVAALSAGYAAVAPLPDPDALALRISALLLRRAAEPFRSCRPDWPGTLRALLAEARAAATRPAAAAQPSTGAAR